MMQEGCDVWFDKQFEILHYNWCQCDGTVDTTGFFATVAWLREVKDISTHASAVPEHTSWDFIWTCCFPWADPDQGPLGICLLTITAL